MQGRKTSGPRQVMLGGEVRVANPAVGATVDDPVDQTPLDSSFDKADLARELALAPVAVHEQCGHRTSGEFSVLRFLYLRPTAGLWIGQSGSSKAYAVSE